MSGKPILDESCKLCAGHYQALRHALMHKGLWGICVQDSFLREERARMWLQGNCPAHQFDPFVVALLEIRQKVTDMVDGTALGCTLCNAMRLLDDERVPASWIDNVTDLMLVTARTNGLRPEGKMH